jgi:chitin synthase
MPPPASSRKQPPSASPYLLPGSYSPARPLPPTSPAGTLPLNYSHSRGPSPAPTSHYGPSAVGSDVGYSYPARGYSNVPVDEPRQAPAGWNSSVPPQRYTSPAPASTFVPAASGQLPHFEAALARARGYAPPTPSYAPSPAPSNISYNPSPYHQPSYNSITNADPNHPEVSISMQPSLNVRFSGPPSYNRGYSRSPTPPLMDDMDEKSPKIDIESPLITSMENGYGGLEDPPAPAQWRYSADGDLAGGYGDEDEKRPFSFTKKQDDLAPSSTQHFGPAPEGRVSRRNKQTHRQLKEVTLDDRNWNNFVIDAKIPTRLAQCMPVKGVEEQSTTR